MLKKIAIIIGGILALILVVIALIVYWCYSGVIFTVDTDEKVVILTFDDGPNPADTPVLLDLLDTLSVEAAFFLTGKHVSQYPEIVEDIHRRGHVIGNHGWEHRQLLQLSNEVPFDEVSKTTEAIENVLGFKPELFRSPYMLQGIGLTKVLKDLSLISVGAAVNGNDWEETDPDRIAEDVVGAVRSGSIIVLHDGDGEAEVGAKQNSRAPTVAATAIIVERLHEQGYRFISLNEVFGERNSLP